MKNLWIFVALVASFGVYGTVQAADIYDDYYNYDEFDDMKLIGRDFSENAASEKTDAESDLKVQKEIQQFTDDDANDNNSEKIKGYVDDTDGFQLEDNRFQSKEIENDSKKAAAVGSSSKSENDASIEDDGQNIEDILENRVEPDDPNAPNRNEDYALLWGDDSVAPLPVPEATEEDENKSIFDETRQILEENDAYDFEEEIKKAIEKNYDTKPEEISTLTDVIEETKQILAESDDSFDNKSIHSFGNNTITTNSDDIINKKLENIEDKIEQEDTVNKVYADLNKDLENLFETLDNLKNDIADSSTGNNDNEKENDNLNNNLEVADSDDDSEENEKVSKEIFSFFDGINSDNYNLDDNQEKVENNNNDDDDVDLDKLLEDILSEDDLKAENSAAEVFEPLINDAINEPNPDDDIDNYAESVEGDLENIDNFNIDLADEVNKNTERSKTPENSNTNNNNGNNVSVEKEIKANTKLVEDLNSSELEDLVSQFSILHGEDLNINSEAFEKNVGPVHITLKVDEPTVITSPNYPSLYPTDNIVDWVLEGPGKGIELNITDFMLNGALGDYLLIKPGGVDDSGHDGILFTYRLTSERRFRFTDVDRLFMRFESKQGVPSMKGFSLSAKMLGQIASDAEPIPEPEPVVSPPHSTATVALAIRVPDFDAIKDDFQQILADMAEQYMHDNNVEFGLNTTSEVTNITRVRLCPITWPDYESCTAVTFSVSLVYEHEDSDPRLNEDDLKTVWTVYSKRDPFALRLTALGVSEFYAPDSNAITAWLLIAAGVIITMVVLAFVLWRYSCFEGYTRMKTNSDTDSLHNEKRNHDLYPTPHQNLPPLYAENEYKWPEDDTTKVDVGGFANRSYARDMYDFDSDEDVMTPRDRKGVVTAKDYSSNV